MIPKLLFLSLFLVPGARADRGPGGAARLQDRRVSVVRVNSTNQDYDFFRPWSKKNPRVFHGLGAVIEGNRVLVTAQLVANHNYVELERAESGQKTDARVLCVDYEANLALLEPTADQFLAGIPPLELTQDAAVGDRVNVLQLESNDALVATPGPITTIEVGHYQLEGTAFLIYRLSLPLQYKEGSFTAPVIKDGKLAGILMRYDPRAQSVDVLPAPVIEHFLKDVGDGPYNGFPRAGMDYAPTRDPQLRHYAKLPASGGGVYVTDVVAHGPGGRSRGAGWRRAARSRGSSHRPGRQLRRTALRADFLRPPAFHQDVRRAKGQREDFARRRGKNPRNDDGPQAAGRLTSANLTSSTARRATASWTD